MNFARQLMMQIITKKDLFNKIKQCKPAEGVFVEAGVHIKIKEYVPYICTAIHAGHGFGEPYKAKSLINDKNRLREEDPYTDRLIDSFPITITALNSRFQYDLNRSNHSCIYNQAWGEAVWQSPLTPREIQDSLEKHDSYYKMLSKLINVIENKFGGCLIFDLHSYNWQIRQYEKAPVFNLGTYFVDIKKWSGVIKRLQEDLSNIELPNIESNFMLDKVFQGKGYQAEFIRNNFSKTLLLPIEIKKVFMDEYSGELYPLVFEKLQEGIHAAILNVASYFNAKLKKSNLNFNDLLSSDIEQVVIDIDRKLYKIAKKLETLIYVNPINILQEKRKFLKNRRYIPSFKYKQLRIDPYDFKEQLHRLPVADIRDPFVRQLYRTTINAYATKIDMLTHVGTPQFLYNSLRYYGEPSKQDIKNALFLLHAACYDDSIEGRQLYQPNEALYFFKEAANEYGLNCKIRLSSNIVAKAMVDNSKKTLFINRNISLSKDEIESLVYHELGVHMVTTMNACSQPLQIFKLGLPGNTYTQEGLAIFSEYLSGNMSLDRLKQLALRVVVVNMMVEGSSFSSTFHYLLDEYNLSTDFAFTLCLRAYRGGGFTKDYLYLAGFRDIAALYRDKDLSPLLVGKTGLKHLDIIASLIERGWVKEPIYKNPAFNVSIEHTSPILDYLISSIRD